MPGMIDLLDSVAGATSTTEHTISSTSVAHLGAVFYVRVENIVGRWNVVLEFEENGKRLEIARASGIEGVGIKAMTITPPLDRAPAPVIAPNIVRYFTGTSPSSNPTLTAYVSKVSVV